MMIIQWRSALRHDVKVREPLPWMLARVEAPGGILDLVLARTDIGPGVLVLASRAVAAARFLVARARRDRRPLIIADIDACDSQLRNGVLQLTYPACLRALTPNTSLQPALTREPAPHGRKIGRPE